MKKLKNFTFSNLKKQYTLALDAGYKFMTCIEYAETTNKLEEFTIVNRVDIDFSIKKAEKLRKIFKDLQIKATFFIRLHAPEYNPFSFENYRIIKKIRDDGHEIGFHSEIVDESSIWNEKIEECLVRDIEIINKMFNIKVKGVASHGGLTGLNNLSFWENRKPEEFNLTYEAYEKNGKFKLFYNSLYISDSDWNKWKCYKNGILQKDDRRSFGEHISSNEKLIYLLVHPDTYYDNNIYE